MGRLWKYLDLGAILAEKLDDLQYLRNRYTVIGNPSIVNSPFGKALSLNGSSDAVNINNILSSLSLAIKGTIIVWINTTDITATQEIISFGDTDADTRIQFDIYNNGMLRALAGVAGTTQWALDTDDIVFSDDTFYCVALVQDSVSPVLYVNGSAVDQEFSTSTDKTYWFSQMSGIDNARIGCGNWNNGGNSLFFSGANRDAIIFNSSLTANEIRDIHYHRLF